MSLKRKVTLFIFSIMSLVSIILVLLMFFQSSNAQKQSENNQMNALAQGIKTNLNTELESTLVAVESIANNPSVQKMFAERDREGLIDFLLPSYDKVKDRVAQFQFHLPDSTSFLRFHSLNKFGDSLKNIRFTVNETNAQKKVMMGIEEGVLGYGIRVVVPMYYEGKHTGSVEFGNDFGKRCFG